MTDEEQGTYKVVVNDEMQYSIWFADRENPPGWRDAGREGPKEECLAYIEEVWTDMRPLSLRKADGLRARVISWSEPDDIRAPTGPAWSTSCVAVPREDPTRNSSPSSPTARRPARSCSRAASSTAGHGPWRPDCRTPGLAGGRALLLYPPGLEFIVAFFGCLYAGVVAVPAYLPRPNRPMTRLRSIVEDARPSVVLTCASLRKDSARWSAGVPGTRRRRGALLRRGGREGSRTTSWPAGGSTRARRPKRSRSSSTPRAPRRRRRA